jgi:homoserine dehydrogenase
MRTLNVGIIGFGTVGAGVVDCLLQNGALIAQRSGVQPVPVRVADLDIATDRGVKVPPGLLTTDANAVLDDPAIDAVVELVGGTTVAKAFILRALAAGKAVVTANKALLAHHGAEIFAAAEASSADLYYEASVCGGIPIIKALREGLVGDRIREIVGILNGTCNYILTRMENEGATFDTVLKAAQKAGYAEADPGLDIDGIDTAHKATILASLAFGDWFQAEQVYTEGIRGLALQEIHYAAALGYRIKLLAVLKQQEGRVQMRVHPTLIPAKSLLGNVSGVFNSVWVRGEPVGDTLYYGRGAGRDPTASAVVADLVDVGLNQQFATRRRVSPFRMHREFADILPMSEVRTRYYLRLQAVDRPGVLALVAGILGRLNISIASVTQKEMERKVVPMVILTHAAREADMQAALAELRAQPEIPEPPVLLRIEDLG